MVPEISNTAQFERVPLADAAVYYCPRFLINHRAWYAHLQAILNWSQHHITLFGKTVPSPRLSAWYGDPGTRYRYSGLQLDPEPWPAALEALKRVVEKQCDCRFNSVLANWYRDGNDGMGKHRDNEPELGSEPTIASLSLGAERRFWLQRVHGGDKARWEQWLASGSLLVMAGPTQTYWQHALPKTKKVVGGRINLTFRYVLN